MSGSVFYDVNEIKNIPTDFESLRSYGIRLIQQMAPDTWTDYNLHDPGVTILEALCYAITDLAYQTGFDIPDLLADKNGNIDYRSNSFFQKQAILTTNPVTVTDYRKAIIDDIDEIDNAWVTPVKAANNDAISGLYKVVVQLGQNYAGHWQSGGSFEKMIKNKVRHSFVARRNLCEDIAVVEVLKPIKLKIKAEIQINSVVVPEVAMANIYYQLQLAINRPTRYSIERDLLNQNYKTDQIYNGPALKNGIIVDTALQDRQQLIDANHLIREIANIDGMLFTKSLLIAREGSDEYTKLLKLTENEVAFMDIDLDNPLDITLMVDRYRVSIRQNLLADIYQSVTKAGNKAFVRSLQKSTQLSGTYRDASAYYSIQNYFPCVYGIGPEGLSKSVSDERKAQAKQLKAYLMIFEQVLANYLAQLDRVDKFFSNKPDDQEDSYFSNPLYNVPGSNDIIDAYAKSQYSKDDAGWAAFMADVRNPYVHALNSLAEPSQLRNDRKGRMLDHLLARFNETAVVYPVTLYYVLYSTLRKTGRMAAENQWKASLLRDFDAINYNRVRGFNYLAAHDDQYNFSLKMHKLLYIDTQNQSLNAAFDPHKIKFENRHNAPDDDEDANENVADQSVWNYQLEKLTLSQDDYTKLKNNGLVATGESSHQGSFTFANTDISVFKYAVNINNYRIAHLPDGSHAILYKSPACTQWSVISTLVAGKVPTIATIQKLIVYFIGISQKSERLYLIEHILLRPDVDIEVYGFELYDDRHRVVFENKTWFTLNKRHHVINKLLSFNPGSGFKLSKQNKDAATANVDLLNRVGIWGGDADSITVLAGTGLQLYKQAQKVADDAQDAVVQSKQHDDALVSGAALAKNIMDTAYAIKNTIRQLTNIVKVTTRSGDTRLPMPDRDAAANERDLLVKQYQAAVYSLLVTAKQQQTQAGAQAEVTNRSVLAALAPLGSHIGYTGDTYTDLKYLFDSLKLYGKKTYPRLKMLIKGDGSDIDEDFFSFKISVIFPEWPARFQDSGFRACVEGLFKYHAPANVKIDIKWLGIKKMKHFEPLYSTWKQNLLTNNNNYGAQHIIAFLLKEHSGKTAK